MITVERFLRVVPGMHIFTASFVAAGQKFFRVRWICDRDVIVRIDVMMVEIDRELEIIRHSVFELLSKFDNAIGAMLLFPAGRNPLFKFTVTFWRKVGRVSPRKDRLMRSRSGNT